MRKTFLLLLLAAAFGGLAQTSREDSILNAITDYEEFFNELERFIDSITADPVAEKPRPSLSK